MKKSIIKIFLTIFISLSILLFPMIFSGFNEVDYKYYISDANIDIVINNDGTAVITEKMRYVPNTTIKTIYKKNLPVSNDHFFKCKHYNESSYNSCSDLYKDYKNIKNMAIYKDNKEIIDYSGSSYSSNKNIYFEATNQPFIMTYIYKMDSKYIKKYSDLSVFRYNIDSDFTNGMKNININITLPNDSKIFNIESKNLSGKDIKTKINPKGYKVYKEENEKYGLFSNAGFTNLIIYFDSEVISEKEYDYLYNVPKEEIEFFEEPIIYSLNEFFTYDIFSTIIMFILLILSISKIIKVKIIKRHNKVNNIEKNYHRELSDLISPELSSTVIDNKFEIKTFVMSILLNLKINKKINVSNDEIKIVDINKLSNIEILVLELIFNKDKSLLKNELVITFKEIKLNFSNKTNLDIIKNKIKQIYELQLETLYQCDIYDRNLGIKIKNTKKFAIINMIFLILEFIFISDLDWLKIILVVHLILALLSNCSFIKIDSIKNYFISVFKEIRVKVGIIIMTFISLILIFIDPNILALLILIVLILNICIFSFRDDEILTKNGVEEYKKLLGLKNFILDFSLLKEREIKDVILWEDYLVYATAFGISDKITKNIPQEILNINIVIHDVENLISIFE